MKKFVTSVTDWIWEEKQQVEELLKPATEVTMSPRQKASSLATGASDLDLRKLASVGMHQQQDQTNKMPNYCAKWASSTICGCDM